MFVDHWFIFKTENVPVSNKNLHYSTKNAAISFDQKSIQNKESIQSKFQEKIIISQDSAIQEIFSAGTSLQ